MSTITDVIFESITENDELHAELTRILRQEDEPFLTSEQATTVKTLKLESYLREELTSWYEWLPARPIDMLGGEWAMEALRQVDWRHGASLLLAELQGAGEQSVSDRTRRLRKRARQQLLQERVHRVRLLTAAMTRATVRKLAGVSTAAARVFLHAQRGKAQAQERH